MCECDCKKTSKDQLIVTAASARSLGESLLRRRIIEALSWDTITRRSPDLERVVSIVESA